MTTTTPEPRGGHLVTDALGQLAVGPDVMLRHRLTTSGPAVRLTLADVHYRLEGIAADSSITFDLSELDQYNQTASAPAVFTRELILSCPTDMDLRWDARLCWTDGVVPALLAGRTYRIALCYVDRRLMGNVSFYTHNS